ncbi:thioredoxin [Romboutsia lituseburensis]|uniref:thioredoxin n=1 Tax=Romboutsia lituseburensis TaxID=1537 RepID=UPI00215B0DA9|nr:thioredoxin [Romboutsia lituseburensis]MCR8744805.1 thioredoxin [Romboutsia lituseburensis]
MVRVMNDEEFNSKIENGSGIAVVDFFATWCGPCKMLAPVFEEAANEVESKANFVKIDIDQSMELARKYSVSTVPTIMIFKDGKPVETLVGFMPKEKLMEKVNIHL